MDKLDYSAYICSLAACIERNIQCDTDYRELEKSVGFSYRHIREIFKKTTRISLSRYIVARKIANAAFEIRHSKKSITEIAFEYDFSNLDTFTRAFRRDTGLTPSEFKSSAYLCGRRLICPGVFAPVILDLNNPNFTFPKLMEVNVMSEMKKTSDSCVLYGVPKVYYGREADGRKQFTPFPMCLQAVLNYMGQNIDYTQIMAASGAAFRQRWDAEGWSYAAVDIRFTYEDHLKPFELAFKGAGRSFKISENADKPKSISKTDAMELIKSEIDCGRPLIALGVVGPPEACIITGYKNGGDALLGWSLFQNGGYFGENLELDESGYFIKNNWWENTEAVISVGEELGTLTPVKEILENALTVMTREKIGTYEGICGFYGGQAAYEAWAKAVEDDNKYGENADIFAAAVSHGDQECMLLEGRGIASVYIGSLAEKYPAMSNEFAECAKRLKSASECVCKMREARECQGAEKTKESFRDKQIRREIAAQIRKAAKLEKEACDVLRAIVDKL